MKMTQVESLNSMEDSSTSGSSSCNNTISTTNCTRPTSSELKCTKIPSPKPLAESHPNRRRSISNKKGIVIPASNVKTLRCYRNGDIHQAEQVVSLDLTSFHDWNECLEEINRSVSYPGSIQVLYTVKGKKLTCITELEHQTDVVVSGQSPFRLLHYGPAINSSNNGKIPLWRPNSARRSIRAAFTKSVILEPSSAEVGNDTHGAPLQKTFSEHNVSTNSSVTPSPLIDEESSCLALRNQVAPKGRPLSCYNTPFTPPNVKALQSEEKQKKVTPSINNSSSKIPKRILNSSNNGILANGSPALMSHSTPACQVHSPAKVMHRSLVSNNSKPTRASSKDRSTKLEVKKEFIRPRRVKIIVKGTKPRKASRFLLNKKTAVAFDQVLSAITESIKPEWGAVRKVFTFGGKEVNTLEGFFGEEDIFLLCQNDRITPDDLELDSEECKVLKVPFEQTKRAKAARSPYQQRPKSKEFSAQPATRLSQTSYPTHPKFLPVSAYPNEIKEKYHFGDVIGDGNFAVVRLVTNKKSSEKFALKVIDKSKCNLESPPDHEVQILSKVIHPNIILLYDQIDYNNELYVFMELIESGDLFEHIAKVTKFSEVESAGMTKDIVSALAFLHTRNIVHRDIKPENLLVDVQNSQRRIKLGDFGLAQEINGPLFTVCGTPTYVSPEILSETGYGRAVDIWATGVIVYILLCGYPPFVSPTGEQEDLFDLILTGDFEFPPEQWDSISGSAKNMILHMLEVDPDLRMDAESVLEHPWLLKHTGEGKVKNKDSRSNRKDEFQFSVFEAMGLSKLQFPGSIYSSSNSQGVDGDDDEED